MLEPQDPRTKPPVTEWDCSTCKVPSFIVFSSHPSRFHLQNREGGSDVFPVCAGHQVITHKTLRDPCCHTLDSPPHDGAAPQKSWGVTAACCEAPVVGWTHANLYVLDLCGRSNLTKIHTGFSSRSRAVMNENYLLYVGESKRVRS